LLGETSPVRIGEARAPVKVRKARARVEDTMMKAICVDDGWEMVAHSCERL
jgi:hypothetical protein